MAKKLNFGAEVAPLDTEPMLTDQPKKNKTFKVRPAAIEEFGVLAKRQHKKEYELIAEALNDLFAKYGVDQVA